ncbi:MAG: glycoside hydrolase family 25 protein [Planctomycetota bacterium]
MKALLFSLAAGCVIFVGSARAQVIEGIDVSQWQFNIDWNAVAGTDKEFVFIKATDSHTLVDPRFRVNGPGATNAGLIVGVYHFATPYSFDRNSPIDLSFNDAVAEAQWFVDRAGAYMQAGNLPPVLDLEVNASLGKTVLSNWADDFLDHVESLTGVRPIIYANTNWATNYLDADVVDTDLWVANWGATSNPGTGTWDDFVFWQYTSTGILDGVTQNTVDFNRFYGSYNDLLDYTIPLMGDMFDDGALTDLDIQAFIFALEDPDGYTSLTGLSPTARGDFNRDGLFNLGDIPGFTAALGGEADAMLALIPEPTTGLVLLLPAVGMTMRRHRQGG